MAKKINHLKKNKPTKRTNWFLNKIIIAKQLIKKTGQKINSFSGILGTLLFLLIIITSFLFPQNEAQNIKLQLLINPFNFNNHLALAEKFLENHQFIEAEKSLLLAEQIVSLRFLSNNLGKGTIKEEKLASLKKIWQIKNLTDPKDIQKLIVSWEKIIIAKPNYRDGYLQLAFLNYKIYQTEKALFYLDKALIIDPNFEVSRRLKKIITQP
jgi:tetratricopeptide (TPR) repeat protein